MSIAQVPDRCGCVLCGGRGYRTKDQCAELRRDALRECLRWRRIMTPELRETLVEILRYAADHRLSAWRAARALDPVGERFGDGIVTVAAAAIYATDAIDGGNLNGADSYKLRREAAARIEDGRWP